MVKYLFIVFYFIKFDQFAIDCRNGLEFLWCLYGLGLEEAGFFGGIGGGVEIGGVGGLTLRGLGLGLKIGLACGGVLLFGGMSCLISCFLAIGVFYEIDLNMVSYLFHFVFA